VQTLDDRAYRRLRAAHEARVDRWIEPHLARRSAGEPHPVEDFLFTYYSHRPRALRTWHPGADACVVGAGAADFAGRAGYLVDADHACLDPAYIATRRASIAWIHALLARTATRAPSVGCFGLHEWAMVYRQRRGELRHAQHRLRLGARGTDAVVESHRIACTHFDAFRFFTPEALELNVIQPTRSTQSDNEQPGCLHANMDLYKWAYKLTPLVPSELVADCFELARDIRHVDMQASPYDLGSLGVEPIAIETAAGKASYARLQRAFADRAAPLRTRLIAICEKALAPTAAAARR
jgi:hypothetical protein